MQKRAEDLQDNLSSVRYDSFAEAFHRGPDMILYDHTLVPAGPIDGLHHHDAVEVGLCLSGSGVFWVDGEMLPFSAPCVSILYPGQLHKARATTAEGSRWLFVTFRGESVFPPSSGGFSRLPLDCAEPRNALTSREDLVTLAAMVESEARRDCEDRDHCVRGLLAAILILHSRMPRRASAQGSEKRNALVRLESLLHYIDQNYALDLDAESLARRIDVHPATLRDWFHSAMGVSTMQYVHRVRVSAACALLRGTDESIARIASMVGYTSLSAFNRHFKAISGCCPKAYRKAENIV